MQRQLESIGEAQGAKAIARRITRLKGPEVDVREVPTRELYVQSAHHADRAAQKLEDARQQ
eukprot:2039889-Alexandrium_andersonii.AAC.1